MLLLKWKQGVLKNNALPSLISLGLIPSFLALLQKYSVCLNLMQSGEY